ncbi:MAG: spondin domain-containing protein [Proteobacteria bacterium]|nr:spondin domain-containing protein [Pseudomonadota bacterium]
MRFLKVLGAAALLATVTTGAVADGGSQGRSVREFEVTVTNLTAGVVFTPLLVATHSGRISMFKPGQPASDGLGILAEGGDTAPLQAALGNSGEVLDAVSTSGLLAAGASVTVKVRGSSRFDRLSVAGMLLPTNDGFAGLNSAELPWDRASVTYTLSGYDAGTEPNDEICANIPGPQCGGAGVSQGGAEGFVHVHGGIHGIGDLSAAKYDWRNPVAQVTIRRVR